MGPTPGAPAWHPDPTGRHELRWWDGAAFTDQVADAGVTSTDPGPGAGPRPPGTTNLAQPADVSGRKASKVPVILAAAGAFVVVLALLVLLRDDGGGSGTGNFEGTATEDEPGRHEVSVEGGTVLVVEVDPARDFDAVVGFEVSRDDADRIADLYNGTGFEDGAQENDDLVFRRDVGFDGDEEVTFLAVPFGVDATVVVTGFDGSEGDYDISIEAFDLDLGDDPDGDDVLDAVVDADGVPRAVRETIEASLGD
jgi:hypothetical protein